MHEQSTVDEKSTQKKETPVPMKLKYESGFIYLNGQKLFLSTYQHRLLYTLLEFKGTVVRYQFLHERVWNKPTPLDADNLRSIVTKLREKLGSYDCIKTIPGVGFMLDIE